MSSDDIVTRLRNADCIGEDTTVLKVFTEAADETERLREELSNLRLLANLWASEFNSVYKDLKAVRGE